jgi:hypothetical protein
MSPKRKVKIMKQQPMDSSDEKDVPLSMLLVPTFDAEQPMGTMNATLPNKRPALSDEKECGRRSRSEVSGAEAHSLVVAAEGKMLHWNSICL